MRRHFPVLCAVVVGLLATQFCFLLQPSAPPLAHGQVASPGVGCDVVIATAVNTAASESLAFVYNRATETLACYAVRKGGLEFRGVRKVTWDHKLQEYPAGKGPTSVNQIKKLVP